MQKAEFQLLSVYKNAASLPLDEDLCSQMNQPVVVVLVWWFLFRPPVMAITLGHMQTQCVGECLKRVLNNLKNGVGAARHWQINFPLAPLVMGTWFRCGGEGMCIWFVLEIQIRFVA